MRQPAFSFFKWLGFVIAAIAAILSAILGYSDGVPLQQIAFYALAIFALVAWVWHHFQVSWIYRADGAGSSGALPDTTRHLQARSDAEVETGFLRSLIRHNKGGVVGLLLLLALFAAVAFAVDGFLHWRNILSTLVLLALLIIAFIMVEDP